MSPNPIEEIKRIRHQLGADAGYDIHRIFADLRAAKAASNRRYVDIPPQDVSANKPMHPSGGSAVSGVDSSSPAAG